MSIFRHFLSSVKRFTKTDHMAIFYAFYYGCKISENEIWTLVKPEDVCIEKDVDIIQHYETASVYECARKCSTRSSHFAYGTNELGGQGCTRGLCKCHCISNCEHLDQENYWFFKYKSTFDYLTISKLM